MVVPRPASFDTPDDRRLTRERILQHVQPAPQAVVDTRSPVVPVAIRGTRAILPADAWLPRRGRIAIRIGAPLTVEGTDWRAMVQLRDRARAAIASGCEESPPR
jgi:1-acyl-sn-glycerol-3-phosphate acyltransferase